jgi:ribonuclease BN (tRNA processing enzyme)
MGGEPLRVTFLGSGNAFSPGRYWSSFLVNDRFLFDASPVVLPHLKMLGKSPDAIEVIFITHFHADHWFGLPFLFLEYAELSHRTAPLTVVGPPGIEERARIVTEAGFPNVFRKKDRGYRLEWIEAEDGFESQAGPLRFRAFQVRHVDSLTSLGYRVEIAGRTLAYSGDTVLCDALVPLADGADVFVVECSCWEGTCGPHLSPADIVELRRRSSPGTRFVLTHLDRGVGSLDGEFVVAEDLATVTL